jgi:membrane protein DedA with SNARE-associated domain
MPAPVLASITQTLADGVARDGAYAVFAVMALDALLPAGGELTMLVAGAVAGGAIATHDPAVFGHSLRAGAVSFLVLSAAGTLGYLAGALVGWSLGRWGGRPLLERHGRWFHLDAQALARAERWFDRAPRSSWSPSPRSPSSRSSSGAARRSGGVHVR